MPRATPILTNFTAGELSPRLAGRVDLAKYYNACKTLENMFVHPHGGASRRPGTYFVAGVKNHAKRVRLLPFEFSIEQAYILEAGDQYFRFYMNHGQIQDVDSYTKLLLHCNGDDASKSFPDDGSTGHTVTANGDAQVDDAQKKFGTGALLLDGSGDYLSVPDHADWNFGTGRLTMDLWFRFNRNPNLGAELIQQREDDNNRWYLLSTYYEPPIDVYKMDFEVISSGSTIIDLSWEWPSTPVQGQWYHVALIRGWGGNDNDWMITLDGAALGTVETNTTSMPDLTATLDIGRFTATGGSNSEFKGWIDEPRVSKGIARWTANFSPPQVEYPLSGEEAPYEIASPYLESQLRQIQYAQSADVLYLCHPSNAPRKLSRTGHTSWTLTEIDFTDGPYDKEFTSPTITPDGTSGDVNLTASSSLWKTTDVGRLVRLKSGATWYWLKVKTYTSETVVEATVKGDDLWGTTAADAARLGSWSGTTGYPSAVTFHEQRLVFAATKDKPQTIWGSKAGEYEDFTPGTEDTDSFTYTIASDQVNVIRWLKSADILIPGTIGGEWKARGTGTDEPITPTNVWVKPATTFGSANMSPVKIGEAILFVQRQGRKLRELVYSWEVDRYVGPDMSILAEHITKGSIVEMDYQQEPDSVVWAVRFDGVLLGMTYQRPQEVIAWHRHITDGLFESVACIPGDGEDEVWVSVKRTINGATKRYIEYLTSSQWDDVTDGIYLDSALSYEGAEVTTLSGLDHLEGKEVAILTEKGVHPPKTVSSGAISLSWGVTKAHVGLAYASVLQTMGLEAGQREGTAQTKIKRIHRATVRLYQTIECEVGSSLDKMDTVAFRKAGDPMDQLPPLFTGDKEVVFPGGYTKDAHVYVRQQQPLPLSVLAIVPHMATHDE